MKDTLLLIMEGTRIIGTFAPIALDLAIKIQGIFAASGEDITAQIKVLDEGGLAADARGEKVIADRLKELEGQ